MQSFSQTFRNICTAKQNRLIASFVGFLSIVSAQSGNPTIVTGQYDTGRTGANTNEIVLNTSNVNQSQFGNLFSWTVDGWIFAQPLYVPGVAVNGTPTNVVYIATMHNSLYAFNADAPGAPPLWHVSLGTPVPASTSTNGCPVAGMSGPELGILSTPVIDPSTNILYAVSATPSGAGYVHYIHAINIATGRETTGSPVLINATVPGNGYDSQGGNININAPSTATQRTALLLANGSVYAGFGNCGPDIDPWHGWVLGYSKDLKTQTAVFNSTPNGGQGGVWQSGRGLVTDSAGDLYFATGNATNYQSTYNITSGSSTTDANQGNYAMRLVQLSRTGQFLASFPPTTYKALNDSDLDFSSSGPILIPNTNLLAAGGKDGVIYTFNTANPSTPVQSFQATGSVSCLSNTNNCSPVKDLAYWNSRLYIWGANDILRTYDFVNGSFNPTPSGKNGSVSSWSGDPLAISANGTQQGSGILWAVTSNDEIFHAFDASNVTRELWNSSQNSSRDHLSSFAKYVQPTVANGRVYVATHSNQVAVYGLLKDFTISTSANAQTVYQGSAATYTMSLTSVSGSTGAINLSVSGLPTGATANFSPASVNGSGNSTLTVSTAASTPTGNFNLIVTATSGGAVRTSSVSLKVTTPDASAPTWTCCTYTPSGSSYVMGFTAQDTGSGLASISVVQQVNAAVSIPSFTRGSTNTISFTATESGWSSYVKFQLTDVAGNTSYIDPIWVNAARGNGAPFSLKPTDPKQLGTSGEERYITVMNGNPGLKNLRIDVNGAHYQVAGLKDGEIRPLDVLSALIPGENNAITITPLGKPGGTALLIIADSLETITPLAAAK